MDFSSSSLILSSILASLVFSYLLLSSLLYTARVKMAEKSMVLQAIFAMVDADSKNTQMIAARTASNLVLCDQVGLWIMIAISTVIPAF
jgi:hypothetical protein